ncbi:MAG TPA: GPW/gp25 family protein [Nocardioides sp.]|uniref:GPW/gp25 family protein n=1 Tax=Nocardioides sp. TaxID=35761 RepID=UPI002BA8AD3F|nr:GPW/gp25 family protein [Nocardioides sp.]HTW17089.1 GPW/gp25 family protein [Nocardioides sp.]
MPRTLALPIVIGHDDGLATHEQDSEPEIAQSVALLIDTRPGERTAIPDYGMPDPIGAGLDLSVLADVVLEWEERADPVDVELLVSFADQAATVRPSTPVTTEEV